MSAFLGIWLSMGLVQNPNIASYWKNSNNNWLFNTPSYSKITRRDRFQLILKFVHLNNNETAVPIGQQDHHDPVHKVRPVLDVLNTAFMSVYRRPGRDLTVDEGVVGFKGRDYVVQYMCWTLF